MVAGTTVNSGSFEVTTPSNEEIRMTRLFDAPRELVFEVMTRPEHVKRWWGCLGEGYSVPVCEIDLRPGGSGASSIAIRREKPPSTANTVRSRPPAGWCSPRSSRSFPTPCRW